MTQIRRVPMDFDWPLNKVWHGYLRPAELNLPACQDCRYNGYTSTGLSPEAYAIDVTFYAFDVPEPARSHTAWFDKITQSEVDMLLKKGRLLTWVDDSDPEQSGWQALPRTAAEVNAEQHLPGFSGHDALNRWTLVRHRCKRLRITMECSTCAGRTHVGTPEQVKARDAWKSFGPPTGQGWQVWEDVSEGSPISPVFESAEALIVWLSSPESGRYYSRYPLTRDQAEALVKAGGSYATFVGINTADGAMLVDGERAPHALATSDSHMEVTQ